MIVSLNDISTTEVQNYLLHAVAPRPICLASTIDKNGNVNLSPFSFFNLFSSNPPIVIFSPARRVRNNTLKHSLENVLEIPELVINIVDYDMVQQTSLSSCEYPKEINEFVKAGFTQVAASLVKPPMIAESKIKLECKVIEVKPMGENPGAGNLVIAEVLLMHIDDKILDENKKIDQQKIQHVARLGGDWYCKVSSENLFRVAKPNVNLGIGIDALPKHVRESKILTGNHLGKLGNVTEIPVINPAFENTDLRRIVEYFSLQPTEMENEIHNLAVTLLNEDKIDDAWQVLLTYDTI